MAETIVGQEIPFTFHGACLMNKGEKWKVQMESGDLKGNILELEVLESNYDVDLDKTTILSKIVEVLNA